MTSPVLNNSAFSNLDYFSSDAIPLNLSLNSPPLGNSLMLASPKVLGSPEVALDPVRRSIQFAKFSAVNWARPIQQEVRIFGASMQRNRRLRVKGSPSSSSEDEPVTPPLIGSDSIELPGRTWSVVSSCKGLGMSGIAEFDSDVSEPELCSSASSSFDTESNGAPSSPVSTPSRLLASSETLSALSSPSTLEELKSLRLAASDLELEARRHTPRLQSKASSTLASVKAERRIRRKMVPRLTEAELELAAAGPGPSTMASYASSSRSSSYTDNESRAPSIHSGSGGQIPASNPIVCIDSASSQEAPRTSFRETAALHSAAKLNHNRGSGGFYKQTKAAMSALEFSPSTGRALGVSRHKSSDLKSIVTSRPTASDEDASRSSSPLSSRPPSVRTPSGSSIRPRPQSSIISDKELEVNDAQRGVEGLDFSPSSRRTLTGKSRKISKLFAVKG